MNLGQYSQSAAQPGLSIGQISGLSIIYPPIDAQNEIAAQIIDTETRIDFAINRVEKEIELVKELKQSLIAEVVTGKIKIT